MLHDNFSYERNTKTVDVYNQENMPELRFPEFNDEWKTVKLKDISEEIKRKKDNITKKDNIVTISAKYGFIDQKERFNKVIAGNSLKKYNYLIKNEFSYNRGNSKLFKYGCIYRLNYDSALVPNVYRSFKIIDGEPYYFEQLFKSKILDKQLRKIITSTARMDGLLNISAKDFFNVQIQISPHIEEQQKIASFLSAIDKKIDLMEKKHQLLLKLRKYYINEIIDKSDNLIKYFLEDIVDNITTGLNPRNNFKLNDGGDNYYVTIKNFIKGKLILDKCDKISDEAMNLINKRSKLHKNDILFASIGRVGDTYLIHEEPVNWNINESVFSITPDKHKVKPLYLYYVLNSEKVNFFIKSNITGSTFKSIKIKDLKKTPVFIIEDMELQQKYAKLLQLFDNKIQLKYSKIEQTKKLKKALLQKMFC